MNSINNNAGREPAETSGAWRLMMFMFFVGAVFLFAYLGLIFGYKPYVSAQIAKREKALEDLAAQVPKAEQDEFLKFQYQLIELKNLLAKHAAAAKLMPLLEANTNQDVFYRSLDLDVNTAKVSLRGAARSYDALAQQLAAFERSNDITRYQIGRVNLGEGGRVEFDASLFFNPAFFQSQ